MSLRSMSNVSSRLGQQYRILHRVSRVSNQQAAYGQLPLALRTAFASKRPLSTGNAAGSSALALPPKEASQPESIVPLLVVTGLFALIGVGIYNTPTPEPRRPHSRTEALQHAAVRRFLQAMLDIRSSTKRVAGLEIVMHDGLDLDDLEKMDYKRFYQITSAFATLYPVTPDQLFEIIRHCNMQHVALFFTAARAVPEDYADTLSEQGAGIFVCLDRMDSTPFYSSDPLMSDRQPERPVRREPRRESRAVRKARKQAGRAGLEIKEPSDDRE